jgi:hypothetical protein
MRIRLVLVLAVLLALSNSSWALNTGDDILVPAAARAGNWITDLYVMNPGGATVSVTVYWLVRDQANPDPVSFSFDLLPGQTKVMEDVILAELGLAAGVGAFRVTADGDVLVNSRIYNLQAPATFGQGFEGVPAALATAAGQVTDVVGLTSNDSFRTNLYALAGANGATMVVSLRDTSGADLLSRTYTLGAYEPILGNIRDELGAGAFANGTLHVAVSAGSVLVGASKVDETTDDPTTLESWLECGSGGLGAAGTYYGVTVDSANYLGGIFVTVNGSREVTWIQLSYRGDVADQTNPCQVAFNIGIDLTASPVPLADFASGYAYQASFFGPVLDLVFTLEEDQEDLFITGEVSAVGTGWTEDFSGCNGTHNTQPILLGKEQ